MTTTPCEHVQNYKEHRGDTTYRVIHAFFVACAPKDSRKRKASDAFCHDCDARGTRLHACLTCVYFGCFDKGHIKEHAQKEGHNLAMDITHGHIFCFECGDYTYDMEFETISKKQRRQAGHAKGIEVFFPWEPNLEEIKLIKENGGLKKILDDSFIGLRGLVNLGQTCFLNCIVQVLVHTPLLRDYFLSDKHLCSTTDEPETCLACEMFNIFQEFYSGKSTPHIPSNLVFLMATHTPSLLGCQQDAHEFFISILDWLHKFCRKEIGKLSNQSATHCNCIIHQIFTGFYRSDVECLECKYVSTKFEPFWDISLDLGITNGGEVSPEQVPITLANCIRWFTQPEHLKSVCQKCGKFSRTKQLTLKQLPVVTCFHLKRLEQSKKNTTHIMFPECLDMAPFMSATPDERTDFANGSRALDIRQDENKFILFAVVKHMGDKEGGHYVTYIRQHVDKWYLCNDELITKTTCEEVLKAEGYLLFYHKQILEYGCRQRSD